MALGARHRTIGGGGGGGGGTGGGIGGGGGGNDGGNRQLQGFEALLMLLSRNDGYHKATSSQLDKLHTTLASTKAEMYWKLFLAL